MNGAPAEHIGTRIRSWRRRRGGMSQEMLASLAGVSRPYISMVEAGRRSVERRSTLVAIAGALSVSVSDLLGQPGDPTDPALAGAADAVPAIRLALLAIEEGEPRAASRSHAELIAAVGEAAVLRSRSEYATVARLLPQLLIDAAAHDKLLLAEVGYATAGCLRILGHRDLARTAAKVMLVAATEAGHPAWIGAAQFSLSLAMPVEAASITRKITDRALRDLQAKAADPQARQMLGQLHLAASLACSVDGRPQDAADHLRSAEAEAATLGEPVGGVGFNLSAFGPTNIGLWRMAVAGELGEYGQVIELAGKIDLSTIRVANRHQAYWLEYGRALARSGKTDPQARAAFLRAEQVAPVAFGMNTMAHDAVLTMINRARHDAVPNDLRVLATRLGIEVSSGSGRR